MRARKVDTTHDEIRTAFRKCGGTVLDLFRVGDDCPDMLIGFGWGNFLVEAKTGKAKLREGQQKFVAAWPNEVWVVRSGADVPACILAMRYSQQHAA